MKSRQQSRKTNAGGDMNISAMFRGAVEEFDARVRLIGDHQWQATTPDDDWAVRDLVNHVVGEDLWAPPLLAGSTIAEVGNRFDGDVLGADPKAAWTAASAGAVRAVGADGATDRIVHLSFGDFPGREYALQLFADHHPRVGPGPRDRRGRTPGRRARHVLRDLVRRDRGRVPQRGRDRGAAAGARRCGRPNSVAGAFRAQCLTSDQETSVAYAVIAAGRRAAWPAPGSVRLNAAAC
jgi:Mycothiol maleylpyruvate isomerase N-terminal domain